jgi:hypothetical protein
MSVLISGQGSSNYAKTRASRGVNRALRDCLECSEPAGRACASVGAAGQGSVLWIVLKAWRSPP